MRIYRNPGAGAFEEIYAYTDYGAGVARRDGTVIDYAFAWPMESNGHATGAWQVQTGHYDIEDEESGDYFVTPETLSEILDDHGFDLEKLLAFEKPMENGVHAYLTEFIAAYQRDNRFEVPKSYPEMADALFDISYFAKECGSDLSADLRDTIEKRMTAQEGRLRRDMAAKRPEQTVRDWYRETYPTDELGASIDPDLTFSGAGEAVSKGSGFYDALGVADSLVRERVFAEIAGREGLAYGQVYDAWFYERDLLAPGAEEKLRAVIIPEDALPYVTYLSPDAHGSFLPALQDAVGGRIEVFDVLGDDFAGASLYVNDEGLFTCPPNRAIYATRSMADRGYLSQLDYTSVVKPHDLYTILHGDIVAVGFDPETGRDVSLTDAQVEKVTDYFTMTSAPGSGRHEQQVAAIAQTRGAALPSKQDFLKALNDELDGFFNLNDVRVIDRTDEGCGYDLSTEKKEALPAKDALSKAEGKPDIDKDLSCHAPDVPTGGDEH